MSKEKAIIIAANLRGNFRPGNESVGNVLEHAIHIEKNGAVMWSIVKPGQWLGISFPHPEIERGYFYNVTDKAVTHTFDIDFIKTKDQIREKRSIYKYLLESRKDGWKNLPDLFYWVKINNIYRLKKAHSLNDFKKINDGEPVLRCQNYVIIFDPLFKYHSEIITRREIMTDYIGDLLIKSNVTEKDIEELFSYRLADKLFLVDRQGSFKKAGRFDLLYKNYKGYYTLYELKKDIAKPQALDQVKGYMKKSIKKYKIDADKIKGVILAKSIDPELSKALKNEPDIEAKTYFFSIGMKK